MTQTRTETSKDIIIPLGRCFEAWLATANALPADPFAGINGGNVSEGNISPKER